VETNSRSNTIASKSPYSFAPNFKTKKHSQTSDGVYVETIGKFGEINSLPYKKPNFIDLIYF
jgi:hypothetical protein